MITVTFDDGSVREASEIKHISRPGFDDYVEVCFEEDHGLDCCYAYEKPRGSEVFYEINGEAVVLEIREV